MGVRREDGQSVVEFLLITPMMVGLILLLIRVNSAIQVAIVDQQYARAQALFLPLNSNTYPHLKLRVAQLDQREFDQMMLGVSDNQATEGDYNPAATVQNIGGRNAGGSNAGGSNADKEEPDKRSQVRVRNTVTLCTQVNVVQAGKGFQPLLKLSGTDFKATESTVLNETTKLVYCHAPQGVYVP